MTTTILPIQTIVRDPDIRGGRPVLAGTTLRISDLAAYHIHGGLSPEELAIQFDLGLAEVHAGLSYYFSHRAEIDEEIRANGAEAERWRIELTIPGSPRSSSRQ